MNIGLIVTVIAFLFVIASLMTGFVAPSVACGLSCAVLWLFGVLDMSEVFSNFVSDTIIVMIGMLIVIAALMKTSFLWHISNKLKNSKANSVTILLLIALIGPFILGQFIGGVTAMIAVLPLLLAVAKELKVSPTVLVLPASVGSQVGLVALPIGMAASMFLMKNQMMANVGCFEELGFWDLCFTRLPGIIVTMAFILLGGWKLLPKRELADTSALEGSDDVIVKSTLPRWKEIAAYVIFVGSLLAMIFSTQLGLSIPLIATISAFLCPALGILNEKEMFRSINWSLVFMMGFLLSLATALNNCGLGNMIASAMQGAFGMGAMPAVIIVFLVCVLLTQFMDNMSLIMILSPICIMACVQNGISALPIVCAIDASCLASYSTPMSAPSSLVAYQMGGYSLKEMIKFTFPMILISSLVSVFWIPFYFSIR
ncbi:MAG: anion permease [Oscillospiraceae bacterium]|nr:anion permease [Oscillospiraceae bacterium]